MSDSQQLAPASPNMNSRLAPSVTIPIVVYGARVRSFSIISSKASEEHVEHLLITITDRSLQFVLLFKGKIKKYSVVSKFS